MSGGNVLRNYWLWLDQRSKKNWFGSGYDISESKTRNHIVLPCHRWQAVISAVCIYAVFQETQYWNLFPGMGVFDHVRCCLSVIPTETSTSMHSNSLKSNSDSHFSSFYILHLKLENGLCSTTETCIRCSSHLQFLWVFCLRQLDSFEWGFTLGTKVTYCLLIPIMH